MSKTHYHTSDGQTLTRAELDRRIRKAKEQKIENQKNEWGYNFCTICKSENFEHCDWDGLDYGILDCSHIVSVKEATESGRSDLCYSLENIQIICRHHHCEHDNNQLKFKK